MRQDYHFIGVGGIGMSALALILAERGAEVSGSDIAASHMTDALQKAGVNVMIGHSVKNICRPMTVVYSSDIKPDNPEYAEAKKQKLPLLHRSELLAALMENSLPLLVTGTHGKTTTSSLLAHVLKDAGLNPSFAIGGIVRSLGANGGHGDGHYFVAEADESDGSFLKYSGYGAIITNIDNDHMDYWKTEKELLAGFKKFEAQTISKDHLFWCGDDERLSSLNLKGVSYGFGEGCDLHIDSYAQAGWKMAYDLSFEGKKYQEIEIPLVGGHNVLNSSAVFGLGLRLGISEKLLRAAFIRFEGVSRRAEKKGEAGGICIYDDYAHHPTEIYATLRAIKRAIGGKRLIAVFQPHRYTRTKECMEQFPEAFEQADELIVTDIYGAREKPIEGVTTDALMKKIQGRYAGNAHYVPRGGLVDYLAGFLKSGDVLVTMGAGDITKTGPEVLEKLVAARRS